MIQAPDNTNEPKSKSRSYSSFLNSIKRLTTIFATTGISFYNHLAQKNSFTFVKHTLVTGGLIGFTILSGVALNKFAGIVVSDWTTATTRFPCNEEYSLDLEKKVYFSEITELDNALKSANNLCANSLDKEYLINKINAIKVDINRLNNAINKFQPQAEDYKKTKDFSTA